MQVVSIQNQKGGVGKTTLSIHIATALAQQGRVLLVDADPQGSALDWRAMCDATGRFPVVGMPTEVVHREIPALGANYDWVVIDGPPRINGIAKSCIAASDLVLVPVQPSPFDVWSANDILTLIRECAVLKPYLKTRFLINRLFPGTRLAAEVDDALATYGVPVMPQPIRNRTEYAKAIRTGRTALETDYAGPASQDILALVDGIVALCAEEVNHAS